MLEGCKIFVSYAFTDDFPTSKIQDGWVSSFVMYLQEMLKQVLKESHFEFIMEHAAHLNNNFLNDRKEKLLTADVLIVIISPNYATSKVSHTLVDTYYQQLQSHQKIIKIIKFPVSYAEQIVSVRSLVNHQFYTTNKITGDPEEIKNHFGQEAKTAFWLPLSDICFEIKKIYENKKINTVVEAKERYVYLATTGSDLEFERATIKRELERRDYVVLPNNALPNDEAKAVESINNDLKKSILSIHLIGNRTSEKPTNAESSYVEIQNKLAADYTSISIEHGKNYPRLIWIAAEEVHIEEKQKFYIEQLRRDRSLQLGADILQTQIEDFKSAILNYLANNLDESFKHSISEGKPEKVIYLISDKRDINRAQILAHKLAEMGFEVIISSFDRRKSNSRRTHQEHLNKCDMAFVLFFDAKQEWLTAKLQDIIKSAGMGREKPFEQQVIITDKTDLADFLGKLTFINNFSFQYKLVTVQESRDFEEVEKFFSSINSPKSDSLIA